MVLISTDGPVPKPTISARGRFACAILVIASLWLVALPVLESIPAVTQHISTQKRLGVDPSALFYTELEIAPDIAHHVEQLHDVHSSKFWKISP